MFGNVADQADRTESRMSSWSNKVAGLIGAAFAVDAIVNWGSTLINAAEEAQAVGRQTETVLASMGHVANVTADDVAELAEAISLKTGLDDEMIQSGENVLLTFGNVRNEVGELNNVFDRAVQVSTDMSVAMDQDLQSSIVQVGKALNDPIDGLSALSRVGVQFTDDQKAMVEQLTLSGDTLGAQKVILEELERQFGGSAEAQSTASDRLGVAWDNISEKLGTVLLPIFEKVADWLADKLPKAMAFAGQMWDQHSEVIMGVAAAIGVFLVGALAAYAASAVVAAVSTIVAFAPFLIIAGLAIAVGLALYYAYQNWGWFRTGVESAINILSNIIGAIKETIGWIDKLSDKLGIIGAMTPGLAPLSGISNLGGGGGGFPKGAGRNIPKAAEGGLVTRPTLALVGEAGPEAIVPLGQGMGMGTTIVVENHFHGAVLDHRKLIDGINEGLAKGHRLQSQGRGL